MLAARRWSVRHARGLHRLYVFVSRFAPSFAPIVKWIGPRRAELGLLPLERVAKRVLFDCRMCGQCVLSSTGMACPMNCAKQMRNGPCGGVRSDGTCEVKPDMTCVWIEATNGAKRVSLVRQARPAPLLPAIDQRRSGRSTWIEVVHGRSAPELQPPVGERITAGRNQGLFERSCQSGRKVVTVEVAPPDSADPRALLERAGIFRDLVDAINITDGAGGNCHMSSVAASAILAAHGLEPVYQIACRDRNRIAIQGDLLGAAALGIKNILCLTGDDVSRGDHPQAKAVFDLDAVSLIHMARKMCDRGRFESGRRLEVAPDLFIGATVNPFVPPYMDRIANLENKILAGARFIQTQFCFDIERLERFMREVRRRDLHHHAHFIVGVGTLGSARALHWMANNVPGVHIPQTLLDRIAAARDQKAEAKRVCLEMVQALAAIEGVAGVHLMGHRNEDVLAQIIVESGLRKAAPPLHIVH